MRLEHHTIFKCLKYRDKFSAGMILKLKRTISAAINREKDKKMQRELEEVNKFLDTQNLHDIEGRPKYEAKASFSRSEIINAQKLGGKDAVKYLLYRYRFAVYPYQKQLNDFPIVVSIEPTNVCNLRCLMCYQSDDSFQKEVGKGFMDFNFYKKIIDECVQNGVCSIVLASRGEPLLHPYIIEMIKYAKRAGILEVKLNTNATLLNEDMARKLLSSGVDLLVFSVDECRTEEYKKIRIGSEFDVVFGNITKFQKIKKKEFPDSKTRTRVTMVLVDKGQNPEKTQSFWKKFVDEFGYRAVCRRVRIYDSVEKENIDPCTRWWERVYIWWDGIVNPCDVDYKSYLKLGRIDENNSLKEIWLGDRARQYREMHQGGKKDQVHPCKYCVGY